MPLLRDYIAEHERVVNHGREAVRALDGGDLDRACREATAMFDELQAHWRGEEGGLFAVMRPDPLYAEYIDPLVREHRELGAFLAAADLTLPDHQDRLRVAVDELYDHIAKEEDGLFPASLTALDGADWDAAMAGWQEAHPGRRLI